MKNQVFSLFARRLIATTDKRKLIYISEETNAYQEAPMSTMPIYSAEDQQTNRTHRPHTLPALVAGLIVGLATFGAVTPALAQDKKPNILFIMGDDIGWMQVERLPRRGWGLAKRPTSTALPMKAPSS